MPWAHLAMLMVTAKLILSAYNAESITSDCRMFRPVVRTLAIVHKTVLYTDELTKAYNAKCSVIKLCFARCKVKINSPIRYVPQV